MCGKADSRFAGARYCYARYKSIVFSKAASLELRDEFLRRDTGLLQDPAQGSDREFRVQGNDTGDRSLAGDSFEYHVTPALAKLERNPTSPARR